MRSFATIVVIALGYLFSAVEGSGQTAVVVGSSCVVVNQNVKATDGGIVVNQLECSESPENSFILRYVWLDRTASSLMLVSQFDEALKPLVGDVQTVMRNPVFPRSTPWFRSSERHQSTCPEPAACSTRGCATTSWVSRTPKCKTPARPCLSKS